MAIGDARGALGEAVADVRISDRLTDSAVCLVAAEHGPDRQPERLLAGRGAGQRGGLACCSFQRKNSATCRSVELGEAAARWLPREGGIRAGGRITQRCLVCLQFPSHLSALLRSYITMRSISISIRLFGNVFAASAKISSSG
jgi:hypothetical protein